MYGYVYLTKNLVTGKIYVGQKKSKVFLNNRYLGSGKYLKESIKKYGKENFEVVKLCECSSFEELNEKEIYFINKYNSTDKSVGYNISAGGNVPTGLEAWNKGMKNVVHASERTKKKMSESHKGHGTSKETKEKISNSNRGKKRTQEQNEANRLRNMNKRWLNKDGSSKTVPSEEVEYWTSLGWKLGRAKYNSVSWNRGKTKETDDRIASYSNKRKETLDSGKQIGFCNCPGNHFSKGQKVKDYNHNQIDK